MPTTSGASRRIVISGAMLLLLASVAPARAHAAPHTPVADAYTDASAASRNYGTRTSLKTDASPVVRTYMRFDISGATDRSSASLRVYALADNSAGFSLHAVVDDNWGETTINAQNAPSLGPVVATTGSVKAGQWYTIDVSALVDGDNLVSFALTGRSSTSGRYASRESDRDPELSVPKPPALNGFTISADGSSYRAESSPPRTTFTGPLKTVVEAAAGELNAGGGGTMSFGSGTFDLGVDYFELDGLSDVVFQGAGMGVTTLQNSTSALTDTEPFDMSLARRVTIRDLTIRAGGPFRSTSDAIDFDGSTGSVIERVEVTLSRGRGIVFDGKDVDGSTPRSATGNTIRDCVLTGIPSDGIELLAASGNTVTGCTVTNVGGHGIQMTKASSTADQPNKKPNDNTLSTNVVDNSGMDGINLNGGDRNVIADNTVTNSADDTASRDGIRIGTADAIDCDDNRVTGNTSSDTQATPTQRYGLHIASTLCHTTFVAANVFAGNAVAAIRNSGTGTVFG